MDTNIAQIIQSRLNSIGMSQAQFAEQVSATPAQMSIFLRGKGSLSTESLNKCMDLLGINLSAIQARNNLAKEIASLLISKNVSSIDNWGKDDLISFTQKREIGFFFEVKSEKEQKELANSNLIDVESTFPFFKALISYYMKLGDDKPTASKAKQALSSIMKEATTKEKNPASNKKEKIAEMAIGTIAAAATFAGMVVTKQIGAFSLFSKTDTDSLFKKSLSYLIH